MREGTCCRARSCRLVSSGYQPFQGTFIQMPAILRHLHPDTSRFKAPSSRCQQAAQQMSVSKAPSHLHWQRTMQSAAASAGSVR